jgi:uncharacterized protein YndB with AHSA1/START domain
VPSHSKKYLFLALFLLLTYVEITTQRKTVLGKDPVFGTHNELLDLNLTTMQKFNTSIFIDAPKEKVWDTMLDKDSYQTWTKPFNPTSRFVGDWSEDSEILFIGTDEDGKNEGGMVSRIAKNVPYEYLSIEHLGIIKDGVEDTTSEEAKSWAPAFENYTLTEKDGGTELTIDQDLDEQYAQEFREMWAKALQKLKELSEK